MSDTGKRGFRNNITATVHEEIAMDDRLFADAEKEAKENDPVTAGRIIGRLYTMRTGYDPLDVDWVGIAKSLRKSG